MDQASLVNSGVLRIRVRHFDLGAGQSGGGEWVSAHGPQTALGRHSRSGFVLVLETANVRLDVGYDFIPAFQPVSADLAVRNWLLDKLVQPDTVLIRSVAAWHLELCLLCLRKL